MKFKLMFIIPKRFFVRMSFCVLFLSFFGGISLAESPGIKIIEPQDGSAVTPGQKITVKVEAVGGFALTEALIAVPFFVETVVTASPFTFFLTIPIEAAGKINIFVTGKDASSKFAYDEIVVNVQQTATLKSLEPYRERLFVFLDHGVISSNPHYISRIYGVYSDGIKRDVTNVGTTYVSSDPSVVSIEIDKEGRVSAQVHKVGEASINVSNSGLSVSIPVDFD